MTGMLRSASGSPHALADQRRVALVVGVHHHRGVAEHRLRSRRRDDDRAAAVLERIADVPFGTVLLGALDLEVRDSRLQHRVPVHEALAAVDQALRRTGGRRSRRRRRRLRRVHREVLARPVHRIADAPHLRGDGAAEVSFQAQTRFDGTPRGRGVARWCRRPAAGARRRSGCDAGVVGARQPQRVEAAHAVVAHQGVHDRWLKPWPMCSVPVTLGGGSWMYERGLRGVQRRLACALRSGAHRALDRGRFEGLARSVGGVAKRGKGGNATPQLVWRPLSIPTIAAALGRSSNAGRRSDLQACDIRGVVGRTLDEAVAEHLGRAFGTEALRLGEKPCRRPRRPSVRPVARGRAGAWTGVDGRRRHRHRRGDDADVVLRAATRRHRLLDGIQVTGSHNPRTTNMTSDGLAGKRSTARSRACAGASP